VAHDVMGRRKVLLDQLLGVLQEIMKFPTTYENFLFQAR